MRSSLLLAILAVLVACSAPDREAPGFGDIAFINGHIYTVDQANPVAEAVVVRGDTIVYVGDVAGARALIGRATEVRDLAGRLALPGFVEAHMHVMEAGRSATMLELNIEQSIEDWTGAVETYAARNPELPAIVGYGFIASAFGQAGPTRELLDAVVPDRPVLIMDEGWHTAWANTAALGALGVTRDTPDPVPGFSYYKRDPNGDATGYLLEDVAVSAFEALSPVDEDVVVAGLETVIDIMNSQGITTAFDASARDFDPLTIKRSLARVQDSGELSIRVFGAAAVSASEQADTAVDQAELWRREVKGDGFHYNALKIFNDGTIEARTAAMFEDYQGDPGNAGQTVFSEDQLKEMITKAAARNLDVHVHALGDRAVHEALNAIEVARELHPESTNRYTLIHIEVIADQDLPRFGELGVIAQTSPLWFSYDDYGEQFVSEDQFRRYWRVHSLEDIGVRLAYGSDFPATGLGIEGMRPLLNMEIGHTRQMPGEPDAPVQPLASERLSLESLIRGYTINGAYMLHMEDEIGSIEVGKKADLVVLDRNIFEVDPYTIHETKVLMTLMNGNVVFER